MQITYGARAAKISSVLTLCYGFFNQIINK